MSEIGFGQLRTTTYQSNNPGLFTSTDKNHPLFEGVFKVDDDSKAAVESPRITKMQSVSMGQPIISVGDDNLLSEIVLGEGRALFCGLPANLE